MSRSESADRIRAKIQADDVVRVAIMLFGQPRCDNSSLINRLIDPVLHTMEFTVPVLVSLFNIVVKHSNTEGVVLLMKRFGNLIAASAGFTMIEHVGTLPQRL